MQHSKYSQRVTRDQKHHENHLTSKYFELILLGRPKFDKIVSNVEFETTIDEMRKSDDAKSDETYFGPKIEQSLCPDFSHDAASIFDKKRSRFYS